MFGRKKGEKRAGRIPWKRIAAAMGLCLFFIGFIAVFGFILPQEREAEPEAPEETGSGDVGKGQRKRRLKLRKSIGLQCAIATAALFALIAGAWLLWERPWRSEEEETMELNLPAEYEMMLTDASAQPPQEGVEEREIEEEPAEPEESLAAPEDMAAEDEMTVLIESTEPLPQPQVTYVASETIHAHRSAVAGEIVFVGDSRTVGMSSAVPAGDIYIAKVGAGYEWFSSTAIPEIESVCGEGTILVINMGVNDLGNAAKYVSRINGCIDGWSEKGIHVAYLSVNPVVDGYSNATNARVEHFNSVMVSSLDGRIAWIDTYSSLMANGYATQDGLHYKNATYRQIYDLCVSRLSAIFPMATEELTEGEEAVEGGEGETPPEGAEGQTTEEAPDGTGQTGTAGDGVSDGTEQTESAGGGGVAEPGAEGTVPGTEESLPEP